VFEWGSNYVCERAVPTHDHPTPTCDFRSGKIILQQPVEREQMAKLLATGKTDLLDKFISMRTRRPFKAFLAWDAEAGKVNFEFEPRASKFPPRKTAGAATKTTAASRAKAKEPPAPYKATAKAAKSAVAKKAVAKKAPAAKKATEAKAPRKTGAGLKPSPELAAVVGTEPIARTEVIKRIWDYIKAKGLQDAKDKRSINADEKLRPVFGKAQVTMFELAGIVGKHLSAAE
jgi:DNA topoisomerase-3